MIDIEGLRVETAKFSWRTAMMWYMRALGVAWIGAGILEWARIIGILQMRGVWFWDLQSSCRWRSSTSRYSASWPGSGCG